MHDVRVANKSPDRGSKLQSRTEALANQHPRVAILRATLLCVPYGVDVITVSVDLAAEAKGTASITADHPCRRCLQRPSVDLQDAESLDGTIGFRQTALVVAADADTMSGKAKRARELGVPIIYEESFDQMLTALAAE